MTAEERARGLCADIERRYGLVMWGLCDGSIDLITDAIRAAEEAAMEQVARRVEVLSFYLDPAIPDSDVLIEWHGDEKAFHLWHAGAMSGLERHPTFAAALASLTDEERAAWERNEG